MTECGVCWACRLLPDGTSLLSSNQNLVQSFTETDQVPFATILRLLSGHVIQFSSLQVVLLFPFTSIASQQVKATLYQADYLPSNLSAFQEISDWAKKLEKDSFWIAFDPSLQEEFASGCVVKAASSSAEKFALGVPLISEKTYFLETEAVPSAINSQQILGLLLPLSWRHFCSAKLSRCVSRNQYII